MTEDEYNQQVRSLGFEPKTDEQVRAEKDEIEGYIEQLSPHLSDVATELANRWQILIQSEAYRKHDEDITIANFLKLISDCDNALNNGELAEDVDDYSVLMIRAECFSHGHEDALEYARDALESLNGEAKSA